MRHPGKEIGFWKIRDVSKILYDLGPQTLSGCYEGGEHSNSNQRVGVRLLRCRFPRMAPARRPSASAGSHHPENTIYSINDSWGAASMK